ncbi:MAG TPA: hypothetical protein VMS40_13850 [Vicinamibacterales bacterium]|nr:hypothetical protein [Vicinamibacterales bacterium]
MHILSVRITLVLAALLVAASASSPPIHAAQNPITAAREAFRKAQEEAKRKSTPAPGAPAPGARPAGRRTSRCME